jgi:hypothetical protein
MAPCSVGWWGREVRMHEARRGGSFSVSRWARAGLSERRWGKCLHLRCCLMLFKYVSVFVGNDRDRDGASRLSERPRLCHGLLSDEASRVAGHGPWSRPTPH